MILLILLSHVSYATTLGWLPQMLLVTSSQISCEEQQADSLKQRCAQDLCGLPGSNQSVFAEDGALDGFNPTAETLSEVARVERDMQRVTNEWRQNAEAFLRDSERKLAQSTQIDPRQVTGVQDYFSPYVSYQVEGDRIKVRTQFPPDMDPVVRNGVIEWAQGRERAVQTDSVLRLTLGLDSIEETQTTMKQRTKVVKNFTARADVIAQVPADQLSQLKQSLSRIDAVLSMPAPPVEIISNVNKFLENLEAAFDLPAAGQINPADIPFESEESSMTDPLCGPSCLQALTKLVTKETLAKKIASIKERLQEDQGTFLEACRTGILLQARYGQLPDQRQRALGLVNSALNKIQTSGILSSLEPLKALGE